MIDSCYLGDVRDGLRAFHAAGIRAQTCVTSPPYWGLRDYGTSSWSGAATPTTSTIAAASLAAYREKMGAPGSTPG